MGAIAAGLTLDGKPAQDLMQNLLELEVEEDAFVSCLFRVRVALLRGDRGVWTLLDDERVKPWVNAVISVTVGEEEEELVDGYITELQIHIDVEEGHSWVEMSGMDKSCLMNLEDKVRAWQNKSDSDIASEIFTDYQLTAVVDTTGIIHTETTGDIIQRETDIQFLRKLARRNGFECVVRGKQAFFRKPVYDAEPRPVLAAHFGPDTTLGSFDARLVASRAAQVEGAFFDAIGKETIQAAAQPPETLLGKDGSETFSPPGATSKMLLKQAAFTGNPELEALCTAAANESRFFLEAKGEIDSAVYGAALHARDLVPVKGTGEAFSGMYFVTGVRHVFNIDRYVQHFTARRNAAGPKATDFPGGGGLPF